ncbi:MAG: tetratricopeptide repeat protein [Candidatus Eisenbacteria bacterium]|uniref:Tetratricopeptide repeat protein n=1 Tax=Eiseniibacteriota bacterium TaxID=2212470 RepID=A0A538SFA4_UNCEI|nr:MAG: tetratricopeptide repeat protein [Candidatus Eisenbacteria bacterium]
MPQRSGGDSAGAASPQDPLLGRYRIEKLLGRGGMGEVLLARDTLLDRRVALKRLLPSGADRGEQRAAILKEARRASQISDRRIAAIHDVLDLEDQVVLVMEYVDGMTLRERMSAPMSLDTFYDLAVQFVQGIAAAHAQGVIHRDLKPENLMVTLEGEVKILDFGIARRIATAGATSASTESVTGGISGTPQYMAPEVHLGAPADERADIFAIGAVFYEMLTARRPFEGPTYGAVLDQVLHATPAPVAELNPAAGRALSDLVAIMMAKNPDERFATCAELMESLTLARRGSTPSVPPAAGSAILQPRDAARAALARTSRRGLAAVAAGVALVIGAGVAWWKLAPPALPRDKNVALLAPARSGDGETARFALGALDLVSASLRKHSDEPGFQMASFSEVMGEKLGSASEARKILGANLALVPAIEQTADAYRARLDLIETRRGRRIASRTIQVPAAQPFTFLERTYQAAAEMLGLRPRRAALDIGIHGAGTLRFYLRGLGGMRAAVPDARAAIADFETGCRMEPEAAVVRAGLAGAQLSAYQTSKDSTLLAQAETTAREAVRLGAARPEPHHLLAAALETEKKYQEAFEEYRRAHELDPTDDDVSLRIARVDFHLGHPERERADYLASIAERPHCWKPYWWLATWYFRQGDIEKSVTAFREMVRRAPDYSAGYSNLGGVLVQRGDYAQAIDTLKRAIELRPTNGAFANLGTAYFNSRHFQEAVDAYNQSFQFGEASYVLWLNLGDAYSWLAGRKADAAQAYAQAIRLGRDQITVRSKTGGAAEFMIPADLATLFARLGQTDSARIYIARAVSADSTNPRVGYCAALTYWQLGEKARAMAWLARSVHEGYPIAWLRDSPIFADWRAVPEFRALVGS